MKKRLFALVSLLLCTVLLCLPAAAAETEGPSLTPSPGPVRVWGTLTHLEDGGLLVENSSTEALNSVILHGEDILCLDAVTGDPMELSDLKDGETVYAWVGPVMTLSLPPQATAILILANIPADYGVPQYYEISAVTPQAMIAIYPPPALTWTEVTTSDGATIKITDQAELTAFSEDTTVRLEDLVPGTRMLVWTNQEGEPSRVLVFPYAYRGYISCAENGLLTAAQAQALLDDPRMVLVNHTHKLADGYTITTKKCGSSTAINKDLQTEAADAFFAMQAAAAKDGVDIRMQSGYRSVDYQTKLYNNKTQYYRDQGCSEADARAKAATIVNPPGYSEHATGLAADLNTPEHTSLDEGFENTAAFRWLCQHAVEYGFILRYPKEAEAVTEITYEPWHWRYVGPENAALISQSGLCFEDAIAVLQKLAAGQSVTG